MGVADVLLRIGLLVVVECHLANPLVPWMVILAVICTFLFHHFLACPFPDHLRVRVLFRMAWVLRADTSVVVVVLCTVCFASQEEVHLHTLVPLVLRCTLSAARPAGIVVVASTVVEVPTA